MSSSRVNAARDGGRGTAAARTRARSARPPRRRARPGARRRRSRRRPPAGPPARPPRRVARRSTASTRATSSRGRERLHDVVVGAEPQADDAVGLLAAGGQQDDRRGRSRPRAQPAHHLQPVDAGQHEVEHDEVGARSPAASSAAGPSAATLRLVAGALRGSAPRPRRSSARRRRRAPSLGCAIARIVAVGAARASCSPDAQASSAMPPSKSSSRGEAQHALGPRRRRRRRAGRRRAGTRR